MTISVLRKVEFRILVLLWILKFINFYIIYNPQAYFILGKSTIGGLLVHTIWFEVEWVPLESEVITCWQLKSYNTSYIQLKQMLFTK